MHYKNFIANNHNRARLRNGYLNDIANSILVSVDNADPAAAAVLQQRLAAEISGLLHTDTFSGAYEYEYEVDAVSGAIVKSDKEFED